MNNIPVDSIVFSVTYENYIKYIQKDKPEKKINPLTNEKKKAAKLKKIMTKKE